MLPDQLWAMTWNDYERAVRGYHLRQVREWERTRQSAEWTAAFLGVDLKKALKGRRLLELPTDPVRSASGPKAETDDEFMARMKANNFFLPTARGNA